MNKQCQFCKILFHRKLREGTKRFNNRKFCSQKCWRKSDIYKNSLFKNGHIGLDFEKNPSWKGGRNVDEKGYIRISIGKKRWKYEHRIIMEFFLGRSLENKEQIHHLNGNKSDNDISNLFLCANVREHINKFHKENIKIARKKQFS